jgi:hypothetical protein
MFPVAFSIPSEEEKPKTQKSTAQSFRHDERLTLHSYSLPRSFRRKEANPPNFSHHRDITIPLPSGAPPTPVPS